MFSTLCSLAEARRSAVACLVTVALACGLLDACAVGPDFVRPPTPIGDHYTSDPLLATTVEADGATQRFSADTTLPADWWRLFKSASLDAAVNRALADSPTLQSAEASLRQSQDNLRAGDAVFVPWLDAALTGARAHDAPAQSSKASTGVFNVVTASGTISYPLDVFGGERRQVEGLRAQVDQQRYLGKAAYVTLSANVVDACIARAAYTAQARATKELIALETDQLHGIEAQVQSGTGAYANVLSQRGLIVSNVALLAPLEQRISQADHLLSLLEGASPGEAVLPELQLDDLALPTDLPLSLPSQLVRQRPDILAAEAQLHAANAEIGVATAAMFPSFSLNASYGTSGSSVARLFGAGSGFWSLGPSLIAPVFHGGSLWFGRRAAIDAHDQQVANYKQTVLVAFDQVADALKALEHDAQALQAEAEAKSVSAQALALLRANHRAGLVAYVDVLAADVQFHAATIGYLQAVAQRQQDTVALFVALGGGWWNATDLDAAVTIPSTAP